MGFCSSCPPPWFTGSLILTIPTSSKQPPTWPLTYTTALHTLPTLCNVDSLKSLTGSHNFPHTNHFTLPHGSPGRPQNLCPSLLSPLFPQHRTSRGFLNLPHSFILLYLCTCYSLCPKALSVFPHQMNPSMVAELIHRTPC